MRAIIVLKVKFLSEEEQAAHNCRLASPMDVAIYEPVFNELGFRSLKNPYGLILGKNSLINSWVSPLALPVKIGNSDNLFVHAALKGFYQEGEEVFLLGFNEFAEIHLNKFNGIRVVRLTKSSNLRDATALRLPRGYQRRRFLPGQIFFGIKRDELKIHKFELIGFGRENRIEISYKRNDVEFLEYLVAANKMYSYITENIAKRRFPVNRTLVDKIRTDDLALKERVAKRIMLFFKERGEMPNRIDMVSNKIKCPLNYEQQVLEYMFGPINVDYQNLNAVEVRNLDEASKKILSYVTKKSQKNGTEHIFYLTEVFTDLNLDLGQLRMAWDYINLPINETNIIPTEMKKIDRVSHIIINMTQAKRGVPTLYEVMSKGLTLTQVKKGFKKAQNIILETYPHMEMTLRIPELKFPVDEATREFLEDVSEVKKTKAVSAPAKAAAPEKAAVAEKGEDLPLEEQVKGAKFQRASEEPIKFIGNPDTYLKNAKAIIENEAAFTKVGERINTENEVYFAESIYAYLDKKKNLHFSVGVKISGHLANQTGECNLEVRSNNLDIANRFFGIFQEKFTGISDIVTEDQMIADSQEILNYCKNIGAEKNWTTIEEVTLRLNFTTERAQRALNYMEETRVAIKDEKRTGTRYYFPGLVE